MPVVLDNLVISNCFLKVCMEEYKNQCKMEYSTTCKTKYNTQVKLLGVL